MRRHIPEKQSRRPQICISPIRKTKEILDSTEEK
jgi:hypothetical protein